MPTYEYECSSCGHQLEAFQSMTEKRLKKCPECKKDKLQRLLSAGAGVIFKGSGFYATDYKKNTPSKVESKPESNCPADCPNKSCSANS